MQPEPDGNGDKYVLVLIDGNTHPFCEDLLSLEGGHGNVAALRLRNAVARYMPPVVHGTSKCSIVVRLYTGRNAAYHRDHKYTRALIQFGTTFSEAGPEFDAVDCEWKENVEGKVMQAFLEATEDAKCQHIFLAAWKKPTYLSMLTHTQHSAWKVTIVEGASVGAGIAKIECVHALVSFPDVFCKPVYRNAFANALGWPAQADSHPTLMTRGGKSFDLSSLLKALPTEGSNAHSDEDYPATEFGTLLLPFASEPGYVPVNKNNERLDIFMARPHPSNFTEYKHAYKAGKGPCVRFYNNLECHKECLYDHSDVSKTVQNVAKWIMKRKQCFEGGQCRRADCLFGHVCQDSDCRKYPELAADCKLKNTHDMDAVCVGWVLGKTSYGTIG